ncbi:hypothetical protein Syun_014054 [Stephania yunnanensis]|uniref:Uncharacterized protein n=1 Tax=Stephania yunnanensis TaxID=152371 RepID=A0AAP0P971_9MAGN
MPESYNHAYIEAEPKSMYDIGTCQWKKPTHNMAKVCNHAGMAEEPTVVVPQIVVME